MQNTAAVSLEADRSDTDSLLPKKLVVIGTSVGGKIVLSQILSRFPEFFAGAIIVNQHMRRGFTKLLAQHLNSESELVVREADNHNPVYPGSALICPGMAECTIRFNENWAEHPMTILVSDTNESRWKNSHGPIDTLMMSAAHAYGDKVIGVLLSGLGRDGCEGLRAIRDNKGFTIAQEYSTCIVADAPRMACELGLVNETLPLWQIADRIMELVGE